jgi:ketosteroid isomerase-like protein
MSRENVEIVRRSAEAFVRSDWNAISTLVDAEVIWEETPSLGPDASTYRGMKELRRAVESWMEKWSEYDFEIRRYAEFGDDVVVLAREQGQGGVTGAAVEREVGEVATVRNGKITRVRLYGSWAAALQAAGPSE